MKDIVIYVDDETKNLASLKRLFLNEPFEFLTFDSPLTALNEIQSINPSVIISDQRMPEMSGIEFISRIKKIQPDAVCIILTAFTDLETVIGAINKGHVFGYIQKPWNSNELITTVESALQYRNSFLWLSRVPDLLADELLEDSKNNRAIRKFTEAICYELSLPIMIISGYVQLLKDYVKEDEMPNLYISNILLKLNKLDELKSKVSQISKRVAEKIKAD